jgi:site-specific DNA-cytosine methylase
MSLNELSLFSGYGGFSLGLRLAGLEVQTVGYIEIEPYCQEIIKARIKDGLLDDAPIFPDIHAFDGTACRGVVDIITGGFPCQPHSVAGAKRGATDQRNLWPDTLRVIREVEPRFVLLENVPGLLSGSTDERTPAYGGVVVGELASLGYSVHWRTLGADDVGAPHRRKRWWCLGVLDDPEHDGQPQPEDPGGIGLRVHTSRRSEQSEQPTGSGGSTARGEDLADASSGRYGEPPEEVRTGGDTTEHGIGELADAECLKWRDAYWNQPRDSTEGSRERQPNWLGGSSESMADASSGRFEQRQPETESQTWASQSSERTDADLADAGQQPKGAEGRGLDGGREDANPETGVRTTKGYGLADGNNALADADGQRGRGRTAHWEHAEDAGQPPETQGRNRDYPTWPPGPSDADGWERVLRERPDLAPALEYTRSVRLSRGDAPEPKSPKAGMGTTDTRSSQNTDGEQQEEIESELRGMDDGATHRLDRPAASNRVKRLKALGNGIVPAVAAEFLRRIA